MAAIASLVAIVLTIRDIVKQLRLKDRAAILRDIAGIVLSIVALVGTIWGGAASRENYVRLSDQVAAQQATLDAKRDRHITSSQAATLRMDLSGFSGERIRLSDCNATRESKDFAIELADALSAAELTVVDFSPGEAIMCVGTMAPPLLITAFAPHTPQGVISGNQSEVRTALALRRAFIDAGLMNSEAKVQILQPPHVAPNASPPPQAVVVEVWPL